MTENPAEGTSVQNQAKKMGTVTNARQLIEQLVHMMPQDAEEGVQNRLVELQDKVESLARKLESGGGAAAGSDSLVLSDKVLGEKLKKLMISVLFESGVLEKFVGAMLDQKLQELDVSGGAGEEGLRKESTKLVKEFLAQNLGTLFQSEIHGAIQRALQGFLASEDMKVLIDDKFRQIQLYLTTEVIPSQVKLNLKKLLAKSPHPA
jgi:hypothetical protein